MATFRNDNFKETNEAATITFNGWDGKSYNGESYTKRVYVREDLPGKKFVRANFAGSRCYHEILDQKHEKSGAQIVKFFTYFDAD